MRVERSLICRALLFLAAVVLASGTSARGEEHGEGAVEEQVMLFPIVKDGKWGYMDETGKVKIEPKYDLAFDFYEGLACVAVGPLRGYIDKTGAEVIKPQFGWCGRFREGYTYACIKPKIFGSNMVDFYKGSLSWGMIDRTGKRAKAFNFSYGRNTEGFSEGKVIGGRGGTCYDLSGKRVKHDAEELYPWFKEGLVAGRKGSKWGYLDHSMKWVIEPQYAAAGPFSEGLAAVAVSDPPPPEDKKKLREWQRAHKLKWGFIDKAGEVVIEPAHEDVWHFSEGVAPVKGGAGGKWGYMDRSGTTVIAHDYDYAWPMSEGMGRVLVGEKQGYVNKEGKLVIQPRFEPAWEFSRGLARVGIGRREEYREGYIDKKGNFVWGPSK
jgi:hypothetical protein